jgi:hypothetical protein
MKLPWLLSKPVLALITLPLFLASFAQSQNSSTDNAAVRGVRLSYVEGSVQLSQGDKVLTDAATANITLYEGSRISAINDGRAEIQLDDGSLVRLTPASTLTLNLLRQEGTQTETELELNRGMGYFELKPPHDGSGLRIKFGDTLVTSTAASIIRINFDNAPGSVAVFTGEVHLERPSGLSVDVPAGENLDLDVRDATHYSTSGQIVPDSWDGWNRDRDLALSGEASEQTPASQSMANGAAPTWNDLDANGNWYNVPDVGPVWSPNDAAYSGWDPYGAGYWLWSPRFGYTWVSAEPWGYLPYRCGLWNYYDNFGWGWAPGFGGCNPWFVGGFWFANVRFGPPGWHYPHRPNRPLGGHGAIAPRIAVNHNVAGGKMIRSTSGPVSIGGHSIEPMRPLAARSSYSGRQGGTGQVGRSTYSGTNAGSRPGLTGGGSRPVSSQSHASSSSGGSHSSGGSSSHSSGGGGGGGGGHSGGGGGGGGGGHH